MTVLQVKHACLRRAGVANHWDFVRLSPQHFRLWQWLNGLGMRGVRHLPDEEWPPDVVAASEMSHGEVREAELWLDAAEAARGREEARA